MQLVQGYSIDWIHNQYIWKLLCLGKTSNIVQYQGEKS